MLSSRNSLAAAACLAAAALALAPAAAPRARPRPDLRVTAVSGAPATLVPGGSFSAVDTTANRGAAPSKASKTRYYLSLDAGRGRGDIRLAGARAVPALARGKSSRGSARVTAPASIATGSYRLLACSDDLGRRREANERNNCRAATGRVAVSPVSSGLVGGTPEAGEGIGSGGTGDGGGGTGDGGGGTGGSGPPPPPPPGAPASVGAGPVSDSQINLSWSAVSDTTGYRVLRSTTSGGPYSEVGTPTATSFSDTGLSANTTYFYVVQATNAGGSSPNSAQKAVTTDFVCSDSGTDDTATSPTNLSSVRGDSGSDTSTPGSQSICRGDVDWYTIQVIEDSSSDKSLNSQFALEMSGVPPGSNRDLDLCVFRAASDPSPACSENLGGATEIVKMKAEDDFIPPGDDSASLLVRVEGASNLDLNSYTLTVTGNVNCGAECHLYNP